MNKVLKQKNEAQDRIKREWSGCVIQEEADPEPVSLTAKNQEMEIKDPIDIKKTSLTTQKKETDSKLKENDSDEDQKDFWDNIKVDYSFPSEPLLALGLYDAPVLDYVRLFSDDKSRSSSAGAGLYLSTEDFSESTTSSYFASSDVQTIIISNQQAEKTMIRVQYSAVTNNFEMVLYQEREKLAHWVKFNPVLMRLFEALYGVTREIDYSKTF